MKQTPQAKVAWEAVPQNARIKLLNNVWCTNCTKVSGISNINMNIEDGDLILTGNCLVCGGDVARLIEYSNPTEKNSKKNNVISQLEITQPDLSKLEKFRVNTKAAKKIGQIKKLKIKSFDYWDPKDEFSEGIDILETGNWLGAIKHMNELLIKDVRCLDAYSHLGNWYLEYGSPHELNTAKNFYKTGVAIGLKSIEDKFNDVFPNN